MNIRPLLGALAALFLLAGFVFEAMAQDKTCWKPTYGRRISAIDSCPPGTQRDPGGFCYAMPEEGYTCVGPICSVNTCPEGWGNLALDCAKPAGRPRVFAWQPGDPAGSTDGARARCAAIWGAQNCTPGGIALGYEVRTCPAGWINYLNECVAQCPQGYEQKPGAPLHCAKPQYSRIAAPYGVAKPLGCPAGMNYEAGLCYSACREGFAGVGAVCWGSCPSAQRVDCGAMCGTSQAECAKTIANQVFSVLGAAVQVAGLITTGGAVTTGLSIGIGVSATAVNTGLEARISEDDKLNGDKRAKNSLTAAYQGAIPVAGTIASEVLPKGLSAAQGLGVGAIGGFLSWGIGSINEGKADPNKLVAAVDPTGLVNVAMAFMLSTCDETEPSPVFQAVYDPDYPERTVQTLPVRHWAPWGVEIQMSAIRPNVRPSTPLVIRNLSRPELRFSDAVRWHGTNFVLNQGHWPKEVEEPKRQPTEEEMSYVLFFRTWGGLHSAAVFLPVQGQFLHVDGYGGAVKDKSIDFLGVDDLMYRAFPVVAGDAVTGFRIRRLKQIFGPDLLAQSSDGMLVGKDFNFVGADGAPYVATREGASFKISATASPGVKVAVAKVAPRAATTIRYTGWDNRPWEAAWDGNNFRHTSLKAGVSHSSPVLLTWDWWGFRIAVTWDAKYQMFRLINPAHPNGLTALNSLRSRDSRLALFDAGFYLRKYPDVNNALKGNAQAAALHWLDYGIAEGRDPKSDLSPRDYLSRYPDLQKSLGTWSYASALNHYITSGQREGRDARPVAMAATGAGDPRLAVFDAAFYMKKYVDVRRLGGAAAAQNHWLTTGIREGRQSRGDFSIREYVSKYADARQFANNFEAGLQHYLNVGRAENRTAMPQFPFKQLSVLDPKWYMQKYPDVAALVRGDEDDAREHWLQNGMREGRDSKADFSVKAYLERYPDLRKAFGTNYEAAILHWADHGSREGRNPRPGFTNIAGKMIQVEGNPAIYFMSPGGSKLAIPSPQVFLGCGFQWSEVVKVPKADFDLIPTGAALASAGACLGQRHIGKGVQPEGAQAVFFIGKTGQRHIMTSAAVMEYCGVKANEIVKMRKAELESIPAGETLMMGLQCNLYKP